jgi:hypothetical protein
MNAPARSDHHEPTVPHAQVQKVLTRVVLADEWVMGRVGDPPRFSQGHRPLRWTIDTAMSDADPATFELAQNWAYR